MLEKVPAVLVATLIAAVLLLLTVGLDSPDDALPSCETSYFIAPSKPFSSEMIDVRKNPGMCSRPNVFGKNQVMDGDSYEIIQDAINSATNELDHAVFSTAATAAEVGSVCAQYETCLREKADIKMTLLGGIWRLFLWSVIAGMAIVVMRRVGTDTFLARAIPLILAFVGIAVFSVMDYWGEEEYGNSFSVLVSFGAFYFGFVALSAAAETCVEEPRELTESERDKFSSDSDKAARISTALVSSAGMMAPNIRKNFRVHRATTIDELGYSKYLSDLNSEAIRKWAKQFSVLLADTDISITAEKAEKLIKKAMVKASGGREMMNLEVLTLGQLGDALLPLLKLKNWTIWEPESIEYRVPSGLLLRLRIESEQVLGAMTELEGVFAFTQAETNELTRLMCGDRIVVATKDNLVLGAGEVIAVPRDQNTSQGFEQEYCDRFVPKGLKAKRACKVRWFGIAGSLQEGIPLKDVAPTTGVPLKGRKIRVDIDWDTVKEVGAKLHVRNA